jgi:hypothetical protein
VVERSEAANQEMMGKPRSGETRAEATFRR